MNTFNEGYEDYHSGLLRTECPYYETSQEGVEWLEGWLSAWSE